MLRAAPRSATSISRNASMRGVTRSASAGRGMGVLKIRWRVRLRRRAGGPAGRDRAWPERRPPHRVRAAPRGQRRRGRGPSASAGLLPPVVRLRRPPGFPASRRADDRRCVRPRPGFSLGRPFLVGHAPHLADPVGCEMGRNRQLAHEGSVRFRRRAPPRRRGRPSSGPMPDKTSKLRAGGSACRSPAAPACLACPDGPRFRPMGMISGPAR